MMEDSAHNPKQLELRHAGLRHLQGGQFAAAAQSFEQSLRGDQNDAMAWTGLGTAYENLGEAAKAQIAYRNALKLDNRSFTAAHHLGRLLINLESAEAAIGHLKQALEINPTSEAALCDLGAAQLALKDFANAEDSLRRTLALRHNFIPALINLGRCLREQFRPEEAVDLFQSAVKSDANSSDAVTSLASALADVGRTEQALAVLDQFLRNHPDHVACHQTKALALLRAGKLREGFEEYEWRFFPSPSGITARPFTAPRWTGDKLGERTLLIWLEQGIGDEILALSIWADQLQSRQGGQHVIESDPRLTKLLSRSFPQVRIVSRQDPPAKTVEAADIVCPAWSGARFLPPRTPTDPGATAYLTPDPEKKSELRHKYETLAKGRTIVGLSWSSMAKHGHLKTPPLETWRPILEDTSLFFVCLQYSPNDADAVALSDMSNNRLYIDTAIDCMNELDDCAAQISAMDRVVTVSNSTAHFTGALGVPVATLVASGYGGFWYWFRNRADSPWYPSMKLCRQDKPGNWQQAMAAAESWLHEPESSMASLPSHGA